MELIISEKNELAQSSLKYMYPGRKVGESQWVCDGDRIICATNGHKMELWEPEEYDPNLKTWSKATIPFRNMPYKKRPKRGEEAQFKVLADLISKADVIIHAGDADDEGQLIVDEILAYVGYKGPVKRVYLTDNTEQGVKKAYANLIDNSICVSDGYAAEARQVADQNFGIMMTRLYTCLAQEQGYDGTLNIGRVQTALRGLIVRRDREFESHKKAYYYTVSGTFLVNGVTFNASYKVNDTDPVDEKNRLINKEFAIELANKITGQAAKIVSLVTQKKQTPPPLPYNKAEITAAAAKKFKIKLDVIDKTLEDLRLVHELITYGRSDSRYLSDEIFADSPLRLDSIAKNSAELSGIITKTDTSIKSRAFNNELCQVHHGIIPTQKVADLSKLSYIEREMYLLIARSFIAQFLPNHQYDQTKLTIEVQNHQFMASSKLVTVNGWKDVFTEITVKESDDDTEEESSGLHTLQNSASGICSKGNKADKETKPRPRYTIPTLIMDMNNITKYVKDERIRNLLKDKDKDNPDLHGSIGTPATQNGIIKEQFKNGFLTEDAKGNIISTQICRELHDLLPERITMPDITALWYEKQKLIAAGKLSIEKFLDEVLDYITSEVARVKAEGIKLNIKKIACPKCGKALRRQKGMYGFWWGCSGYSSGCDAKFKDDNGEPVLVEQKPELTSTGEKCPQCGKDLVERMSKYGKFTSCSGYPDCKYTPPQDEKPVVATDEKCPQCGSAVVERDGKFGKFKACSGYPKCKWTPPKADTPKTEPTGKNCPKCGKPMLRRKSKDGTKEFLGCSGFPDCKHVEWLN